MAVTDPPPELDQLQGRSFSFYPPILQIEHNEWRLEESNWSEILVHNTKTGQQIWVPRRVVGEISKVEEPVMIVGLNRQMEYAAGLLRPVERRVLNLPKAPVGPPPAAAESIPTPPMVAGVRVDGGTGSRLGLLVAGVLVAGLAAAFLVVRMSRGDRFEYETVMQEELGLTAQDDYYAVVRKLGTPAGDRWKEPATEMQYRALHYPDRHLTVILMGSERGKELYLGAMNDAWRPVHTVKHAGRGDTRALLDKLPRF